MKRLHWLFFMMCLAVLPALQSCDDLDDGYSIGDFSYPNWSTVRVKGNTFYLESDTWGTLWPINTNMGWYQPVDGQRIITIFNPIYDNYEGYDHAVKIEKIWHALTKSVEPLTSENDEEYGNDPVFIYKGDITISGGYMNIIFMQNLPKNSGTKHRISLVQRAEDAEVPLAEEGNDDGDDVAPVQQHYQQDAGQGPGPHHDPLADAHKEEPPETNRLPPGGQHDE